MSLAIALIDGRPVSPCNTQWLVEDTVAKAAEAGLTWSPEDVHQHILVTVFSFLVPPEFQTRYDEMNRELRALDTIRVWCCDDAVCNCREGEYGPDIGQ